MGGCWDTENESLNSCCHVIKQVGEWGQPTNKSPAQRHGSQSQLYSFFGVVDQTLTVLIFFGRPDRKLFLTGVPILPWSPPRTQRTSKSHNCPYLIIFWWFQLPINMYLHLVNHFVSYLQQTDSQQLQISSVAKHCCNLYCHIASYFMFNDLLFYFQYSNIYFTIFAMAHKYIIIQIS